MDMGDIYDMMCRQICGPIELNVNLLETEFKIYFDFGIFIFQGLLSSTSAAEVASSAPKNDTSDALNTFYFYEVRFCWILL